MIGARVLLCGMVAGLALVTATAAKAEWNMYYNGTVGPGNTQWTCCLQVRYAKLVEWTPGSKCVKNAYGNWGSDPDFFVITECDGVIIDHRDSVSSTASYCKNTPGTPSISAQCFTCINNGAQCNA